MYINNFYYRPRSACEYHYERRRARLSQKELKRIARYFMNVLSVWKFTQNHHIESINF